MQANTLFVSTRQMNLNKGTTGPDPGHYSLRSSIGPQASSTKPNAPAFSQPKRERLKNSLDDLKQSLPPPEKWARGNPICSRAQESNLKKWCAYLWASQLIFQIMFVGAMCWQQKWQDRTFIMVQWRALEKTNVMVRKMDDRSIERRACPNDSKVSGYSCKHFALASQHCAVAAKFCPCCLQPAMHSLGERAS